MFYIPFVVTLPFPPAAPLTDSPFLIPFPPAPPVAVIVPVLLLVL